MLFSLMYFLMLYLGALFLSQAHPLMMSIMIIMQTIIVCLIIGTQYMDFWYSYILFLIFIGGLLVLFIYISSLAENETFSFKKSWYMKYIGMSFIFLFLYFYVYILLKLYNKDSNMFLMVIKGLNVYQSYIYSENLIKIILFLTLYLLFCLIVVTSICQIIKGPLRQKF
uniref:NADH-ubiquinone oxidoreductase chain 6 n=1 Tax=Metaperipatus inae TaxID=444703 RepID=B3F5L1_9BILA|nr:NADH dehydrogenase subunit 6 [Metaperipatus inae]ABQ95569.1 NADH dehydrogenase subunit 6 [Metaperipatus inae]